MWFWYALLTSRSALSLSRIETSLGRTIFSMLIYGLWLAIGRHDGILSYANKVLGNKACNELLLWFGFFFFNKLVVICSHPNLDILNLTAPLWLTFHQFRTNSCNQCNFVRVTRSSYRYNQWKCIGLLRIVVLPWKWA